ncbi:MAG: CoA transferase [bacterium]
MKILEGLRVIDASQFNAGPTVSLYLAGYGADVIKVERPGGEDSRAIGPFKEGESSYFMSLNRGKRSITVNLKEPGGVEVFGRLARSADVLVENYLPGVMDRLGVGWEALRAENPRLIYGAVSGFGREGPGAKRPAFDSLLQAAGGLISVTGPEGGPPVRVGVSIVDIASGLYLLSGILSALWRRERTGEGCRVDASMLAATVNIMENPVARHSFTGEVPRPEGLSHPIVSPFSGYRTRDGLIFVAISNTNRYRVLVEALGRTDLAADPLFRENKDRVENEGALREVLEGILKEKTTAEWEEFLIPRGVTVSAINDVAQVKERFPEAFVEVDHPVAGPALLPASPVTFGGGELFFSRPAPTAGEHTGEILQEIGYSPEEIEKLRESKAV